LHEEDGDDRIHLRADEFLRHPLSEPAEETHQGGDFRD